MSVEPENAEQPEAAARLKARLAERLSVLQLSERAASMMATGKPDAIRYIRVRDHVPSYERLFAIARTLRTSPEYLLGTVDDPEARSDRYHEMAGQVVEARALVAAHQVDFERNLGVFAVETVNNVEYEGQIFSVWWINLSSEVDIVRRPIFRWHREKQMYAVAAPYPLIGCGDLIIVETHAPIRVQESVLVRFTKFSQNWSGPQGCSPYICGLLLRRTENDVVVQPSRSDGEVRLVGTHVSLNRIISVREMLG